MNLEEFREMMAGLAASDKEKNQAQISAPTLQEALKQASIELAIPVKEISYEILQRSRKGVFGVGYRECVIIAYQSDRKAEKSKGASGGIFGDAAVEQEVIKDADGRVSVRCLNGRVFLRVKAPVGNGKAATMGDVEYWLKRRGIGNYDAHTIDAAILEMDEKEYMIGEFFHNAANDSEVDIHFSDDDMAAYLVLREPGPGGEDMSENAIVQYISEMNIKNGINKEELLDFIHFPIYSTEFLFASGQKPQDGADATIEYFFETDRRKLMTVEEDGRVNFKNTNLIQNVEAGQVLAKKILAQKGVKGFTVTGRALEARDGEDISLNAGDNTKLSDDKMTITAELNGQVLISSTGRISVAPVFYVSGDVNIKNGGNVDFIGAVVIRGNVEDGYSVKATKNIEIGGSVGNSIIDAGGDIQIAMGINGREAGVISAAGNVYAKFVENATLKVAGDVVVRDAIVNSNVNSNSSIICTDGKKGRIVGGKCRASKSVVAKTLGSESYTETIIEVGVEPEKRQRFEELQVLMEQAQKDISDLTLNLNTIDNNPQAKANMSPEKIENLKNMRTRRSELTTELTAYTQEFTEIKEYLDNLKQEGYISVAGTIYPNVKLNISGAELTIKNEMKWTTFYKEGPVIRMKEYVEEKKNAS